MRALILACAVGWAGPALALTRSDQSLRDRPLVLDDGRFDLYGGVHLELLTTPTAGIADFVHVPLGFSVGLGSNVEIGLQIDTQARPAFSTAFSPNLRLALGAARMLAVGLSTTLPFGFATYRLGPEDALPVRLELPAFRYETLAGGIQASACWEWTFAKGPDQRSFEAAAVGILGIGSKGFAVVDLALRAQSNPAVSPEPEPHSLSDDVKLEGGLGVGWSLTSNLLGKIGIFTPDFIEFNDMHLLAMLVHRWQPTPAPVSSSWL